jgi:hypothetical protein
MTCRGDIQALSTRVRAVANDLHDVASGLLAPAPCDARDLELWLIGLAEVVTVAERKLSRLRRREETKGKAVSRPGGTRSEERAEANRPHDATTPRRKANQQNAFTAETQSTQRKPDSGETDSAPSAPQVSAARTGGKKMGWCKPCDQVMDYRDGTCPRCRGGLLKCEG